MICRISRRLAPLAAALIAALLALALQSGSALASTCSGDTWTGGSGNWDTPGDWSAGVPGSGTAVCITNSGSYTITLTPYNPGGNSLEGDTVASLTLGASGNSGTQTLEIEGEASVSNSNETDNETFLTVTGASQIADTGELELESTSIGTGNGGPDGGYASFDTGIGSTNAGTIISEVGDPSWNNVMYAVLANSGTIDYESGTTTIMGRAGNSAPMVIANSGTIDVASGATAAFDAGDGSSFTQEGTYTNSGTTTATSTMDWIQSGGSQSGNPIELTGQETLEDSAGSGVFDILNCGGTGAIVTGTIPAGQTIDVLGDQQSCGPNTVTSMTLSGSMVVNDGTITLDANDGLPYLQGNTELDNHGTLNATVANASFNNTLLSPLVNESGGTVNVTGGTLYQTGGTATTNDGSANIGAGANWIVQGGSFTNNATLAIQLASASSYGQLTANVASTINAGGTLAAGPTGGYSPATGTEFQIIPLDGGKFSGTFANVTGGYSVDYGQEAASTPFVGLVYGSIAGGGGGGAGSSAAKPTVGAVSGGSAKATVHVSCPAGASSCMTYSVTGTITEHLKKGKIVAISAKAKKKPGSTTKVVTVASGNGAAPAPGASAAFTLKLNATGTVLLKKFHKLSVRVTVSAGGAVVNSQTVTITSTATKKHKK